jgi:GAF domain-containing protein
VPLAETQGAAVGGSFGPIENLEMTDKAVLYDDLAVQIDGLLTGEADVTANLANAAAALYHSLPLLIWSGF